MTDQLDDLTRDLARAPSRRQALRILVGVVLGGAVAAAGYCSFRRRAVPETRPAVPPAIPVSTACSQASTCGSRSYCSADERCICVKTPEDEIRCGQIPSCEVPTCAATADCAKYGAGFLCDSPDSGCCNEERRRCMPPCGYVDVTREGAWTGRATRGAETLSVTFTIRDDDGDLEGDSTVADPVNQVPHQLGTVKGWRYGQYAEWTTSGGAKLAGTFEGDAFRGTMTLPGFATRPSVTAEVTLTRSAESTD